MRDPRAEAQRWLEQARNDLDFARYAMAGGYHHQACFVSQQCAEKALKALHYADGAREVIGHSVVGLLGRALARHPGLESLNDFGAELDLFYIPTRYPNGLVEGTPYGTFTRAQAERALTAAEAVLLAIEAELAPAT
jgi:HEPN domain-containing protein